MHLHGYRDTRTQAGQLRRTAGGLYVIAIGGNGVRDVAPAVGTGASPPTAIATAAAAMLSIISAVPEPANWLMLALGLKVLVVMVLRRRRRASAAATA